MVYKLIHTSFDEAPAYTVLSYCWEGQTPDEDLKCNESTLYVTANVKTLLPYLSKTDGSHFVWIDGLCINQNDVLEKNHQVRLMEKIYAKATKVVI